MTDRVNYLTVALEADMRLDDSEELIRAIRCLRNVLGVKENVVNPGDWVVEQRVRDELTRKLIDVVRRN